MRRVEELDAEIARTEGNRIVAALRPVRTSYTIFTGNARELAKLFALNATPQSIPILWSVRNRALLDAFLAEVERHLHNYVASAMSLVEHTRRAMREIYPPESRGRTQYEGRVRADFGESPESNFVQDLRDFFLHVDAPAIVARMLWSQGEGEHRQFLLPRVLLQGWDRWSRLAKDYLANQPDDVSLEPLITSYTTRVTAFYVWLDRWNHEQKVEAFNELEELNSKVRQTIIEGGLADPNDELTRPRSPEELREVVKQLAAIRLEPSAMNESSS